jgi:hypothetical protein
VRFGTIKRNAARLPEAADTLAGHTDRFLAAHQRFEGWRVERAAIAPTIEPAVRAVLQSRGVIAQDMTDLIQGL